MIYTLIHEKDPIPCRTTYIEYRSRVKIFINFLRNTTQFHWFSILFLVIVLRHQSWGVPFGEPEKLIVLIQYKKKIGHFGWPVFLLKRCSLGTSDIQGCYSPKGITYMIYTLIHGRDPIPCRTTYIEYRSPVNYQFFEDHHRIPLVFIAKYFFFHSSMTPIVGVPFGELEKIIFLIQYKKKLIISGCPFFLLKCSSWGTSDIQGCYSPKGITYIMYTLIRPLCMKETQFLAELHT